MHQRDMHIIELQLQLKGLGKQISRMRADVSRMKTALPERLQHNLDKSSSEEKALIAATLEKAPTTTSAAAKAAPTAPVVQTTSVPPKSLFLPKLPIGRKPSEPSARPLQGVQTSRREASSRFIPMSAD